MGLIEEIEREEAELKKLEEAEEKAETEVKEEVSQEEEEEEETSQEKEADEEEDDTGESEDKETSDEETSDEESKKSADEEKELTEAEKNNYAAQLRRERKEKRELQERLARIEEGRSKPQKQDKEETEAEELSVEERLARIEEDKQQKELHAAAINEFNAIEAEFSKKHDDYEAASAHMIQTMFTSVRNLNPGITEAQAIKAVQNHVLSIAANAATKGHNPAEVLYDMAFDHFGFDPSKATGNKEETAEEKPQFKKTGKADNLKTAAKNRLRSATGLKGGGQSTGGRASVKEASNMDLASFGKLSEAEMDALIAQAQEETP